jgi:predicted ester cyclase
MSRDELAEFYASYNRICNRHAFTELVPYVGANLVVNGQARTASEYVADLQRVVEAFPDYEWAVQRLVIEDPWISVHLQDVGTHRGPWLGRPPTGSRVSTDEFAMYRLEDGRIVEIWVTADNARLLGL